MATNISTDSRPTRQASMQQFMEVLMNRDEIAKMLKLTADELALLCELADSPWKSAFGSDSIGADAPGVRRRLIKRGLITPLQPRKLSGEGRDASYDFTSGGALTRAGHLIVARARGLGWTS